MYYQLVRITVPFGSHSKNLENTHHLCFSPKTQHRFPFVYHYVIISGHVISFKLILYIRKLHSHSIKGFVLLLLKINYMKSSYEIDYYGNKYYSHKSLFTENGTN